MILLVGKLIASGFGKFFGLVRATGSSDHRGWGSKIEWLTLEDGYAKARNEDKAMMLIIHKMSCPACMNQKRWFGRSPKIRELSKHFVMVNLEVHEVPRSHEFFPDGNYVPRILFFSAQGKLMPDVRVKYGNPEYKYNYQSEADLVHCMKSVI